MIVLGNRYELGELLGRGSSGVVHRAHDLVLHREVAVKIVQLDSHDARARLLREAQVAAHFRHPGACEIYEIGESATGAYIVMELVSGVSLDVAASVAMVPLAAVIELGRRLVDVLVAAHAIGLVHRDLKPENIVVDGPITNPTHVRVIDFGLAFLVAPPTGELGRLTQEDAIIGTPAYMAPEQIDGRAITPAADIYALGCVLYELATRRVPFIGGINKVLAGHLYLPPIPPSELDATIGPSFDQLILQMLAKAPADRPPAAEVARALDAIARGDRRPRTATGRSRAERSFAAPAGDPAAASVAPLHVGLLHDDPALRDALIARGLAIVDTGADVLLLTIRAAGPLPILPPANLPIVGLAEAITPPLLAQAIQGGFAAILRWPMHATELLLRLRVVRDEFRPSSRVAP